MANIISDINDRGHLFQSSIDSFFQKLNISGLLSRSNFYKEAGFSCTQILKEIFTLVFTGKNLYRALSAKDPGLSFRKNTAYRFLNCGYFNWEKLLYLVMSRLIAQVDRLTGSGRESVLIVDDSLFSRNNSKKVELLARVFDHTSHKFCRGFRMLTLGWSDGNTFLPVSFSLLSSANDDNVLCPANSADKRTNGYKRRIRSRMSSTDILIDMLRQAKDLPARFVLFDSWFTMPKTVVSVKEENRDVIGMLRISDKIHYFWNGRWQNIRSIYKDVSQNADNSSQIIGSVCVMIRKHKTDPLDKCIKARIVFVRERNSNKWLAIMTTDTDISEEEIIRIYGKRWDIETFFKVCKSHLALAREFQGRSYDMLVATTSIVFLRYAMLSIEARNNCDDRTIGELFFLYCKEIEDIKLSHSLMLILSTVLQILGNSLNGRKDKIQNQIIETFMNALPNYIRQQLVLCA